MSAANPSDAPRWDSPLAYDLYEVTFSQEAA